MFSVLVCDLGLEPADPFVEVVREAAATLTALDAGIEVGSSVRRSDILAADAVVLASGAPFAEVMSRMSAAGMPTALERRMIAGAPILALGTGFDVMFDHVTGQAPAEPPAEKVGAGARNAEEFWFRDDDGPGTVSGMAEWPGVLVPFPGSGQFTLGGEGFTAPTDLVLRDWTFDVTIPTMKPPEVFWADAPVRHVAHIRNGALEGHRMDPVASGAAGVRFLARWLAGHLPPMPEPAGEGGR